MVLEHHRNMSSKKLKARKSTSTDEKYDILTEKRTSILAKEEKEVPDKKEVKIVPEEIEMSPTEKQTSLLPVYIKSYSNTQLKITTLDYLWQIDKFRHFFETVDILQSPTFPENGQYLIQMNIIRKANSVLSTVQFYLRTDAAFTGSCAITVKYLSETFSSSKAISGHIKDMTLLIEIFDFTYGISGDVLIIHAEFEIFDKTVNNIIHMNLLPPLPEFSEDEKSPEDLSTLLSKNGKSIKFIIGTEHYVVSKKLLYATNSNYFKNLCLTYKEKEKDMTNELLTNSELQTFKYLLLFIMTGLIEQYDYDILQELLTIADKYDVLTLKLLCEHYLLRHITIKNAVELIQLAFLSNAKFLEKHSAIFIKFHINNIVDTKEYQNLPQEDSNKILELIEKSEIFETSTQFFSSTPKEKLTMINL